MRYLETNVSTSTLGLCDTQLLNMGLTDFMASGPQERRDQKTSRRLSALEIADKTGWKLGLKWHKIAQPHHHKENKAFYNFNQAFHFRLPLFLYCL